MKSSAWRTVILFGLVSLFADITYEGARGIIGPYLLTLGASFAAVGILTGTGEALGYLLRYVSGALADWTRSYWAFTIIGYAMNLVAVPLLAFAGSWKIAGLFIIAERMGKAIRTPARDVLLSHATASLGRGRGFGVHEAMDQIGAMTGPLFLAFVLKEKTSMHDAFLLLGIPAVTALAILFVTRVISPKIGEMEGKGNEKIPSTRKLRFYLLFALFTTAGFISYPLLSYAYLKGDGVALYILPLLYAVLMGIDAVAALIMGFLYDRFGLPLLRIVPVATALALPALLSESWIARGAGMVLWGTSLGAQESIMRAAIAQITPKEKRGKGYGTFHAFYGIGLLIGGAVMGLLLPLPRLWIILFAAVIEAAALLFLFLAERPGGD